MDQGITVFVISWVNPDRAWGKTWENYMKQGPLAAIEDAIEQATGEMKVHTMGYCVGGTLLATTLALACGKAARARDLSNVPGGAGGLHQRR